MYNVLILAKQIITRTSLVVVNDCIPISVVCTALRTILFYSEDRF